MTHDEMIAVIAAHRDGLNIESCTKDLGDGWILNKTPVWDFSKCNYRIAEPRWRDATIDDLKRAHLKCRARAF